MNQQVTCFAVANLTQQTLFPCLPWEFSQPRPDAQICGNKEDRAAWYQDPSVVWQFYCGIEPINPNQRVSKNNPPFKLHVIPVDFDQRIPDARIDEVIEMMEIKPSWIERSLGDKTRLVWLLPFPVLVETYDFCVFIHQRLVKWLNLNLLPGLDEPQFTRAGAVLLCNGSKWRSTGHGPIPETKLQAFMFDTAHKFNFTSSSAASIPIETVEAKIREKFPTLAWPGDFVPESHGPSFWIPESASPTSAIVKKDGMYTFSAHADKAFYTWGDILGKEFVRDFFDCAITQATKDVWFDSKHFWRPLKDGKYIRMELNEITDWLEVDCGISHKADRTGVSLMKRTVSYIRSEKRIHGAASFVFRPRGEIFYMGERYLNTYRYSPIKPSEALGVWGPNGNFPHISEWLETLFVQSETMRPWEQLYRALAWHKQYYESALNLEPTARTAMALFGGVGCGKTFWSRYIVGASVGGFLDATGQLTERKEFTDYMYEYPHWSVDDETISPNAASQLNLQQRIKHIVANEDFLYNRKFQVSSQTSWRGGCVLTANTDSLSMRVLGPMDYSVLSKITMLLCVAREHAYKFPDKKTWADTVRAELPFFLNWLLHWEIPDWIERDSRFGLAAWHESSLLDQAYQSSVSGVAKEVLYEALVLWFRSHPEATEWKGSASQLLGMIQGQIQNDTVIKHLRIDTFDRSLEFIQREDLLKLSVMPGPVKTRLWVIKKPEEISAMAAAKPAPVLPPQLPNSEFDKPSDEPTV